MKKKEFFSIEEAAQDWTLNHPDLTIKDFLVNVRGCSLSRYKYLINKHPVTQWTSIRGTFIWDKQEKLLDKMAIEKMWYMNHASKAIQLSTMQAIKIMSKVSVEDPRATRKILECTSILEKNQNIHIEMKTLAESVMKKVLSDKKGTEQTYGPPSDCLIPYDDIALLVEHIRKQEAESPPGI